MAKGSHRTQRTINSIDEPRRYDERLEAVTLTHVLIQKRVHWSQRNLTVSRSKHRPRREARKNPWQRPKHARTARRSALKEETTPKKSQLPRLHRDLETN